MHMHMHICLANGLNNLLDLPGYCAQKAVVKSLLTNYMCERQSYNLGAACNVKLKTRSWVFEKSKVNELSKRKSR